MRTITEITFENRVPSVDDTDPVRIWDRGYLDGESAARGFIWRESYADAKRQEIYDDGYQAALDYDNALDDQRVEDAAGGYYAGRTPAKPVNPHV